MKASKWSLPKARSTEWPAVTSNNTSFQRLRTDKISSEAPHRRTCHPQEYYRRIIINVDFIIEDNGIKYYVCVTLNTNCEQLWYIPNKRPGDSHTSTKGIPSSIAGRGSKHIAFGIFDLDRRWWILSHYLGRYPSLSDTDSYSRCLSWMIIRQGTRTTYHFDIDSDEVWNYLCSPPDHTDDAYRFVHKILQ